MGLADLPRAYFSGFVYWNPSTMNNNDNQPTYDPASATLNWPWLERHGLADDAAFDSYVTQASIVPSANDVMLGQFFTATAPPAEWNFYGDNSCGFVQEDEPKLEWPQKFSKPSGNTVITGYTNDAGTYVSNGDPWIGLPVHLNPGGGSAKLVDVDPVAAWSSQIFLDTFGLGSESAGNGLLGTTPGRAHSRWVFFHRNYNDTNDVIIAGVGSAMWQIALPKEAITFFDASPAAGSLAAQLRAALSGPRTRGLMARFVTYHTTYFQGSAFTVCDKPDWQAISDLYQRVCGGAREVRARRTGGAASEAGEPRLQQRRRLDRSVDLGRHADDGRRQDPSRAGEHPADPARSRTPPRSARRPSNMSSTPSTRRASAGFRSISARPSRRAGRSSRRSISGRCCSASRPRAARRTRSQRSRMPATRSRRMGRRPVSSTSPPRSSFARSR